MQYSLYVGDMTAEVYHQCPDCKRNLTDDIWKVDERGYALFHTKETLEAALESMACPDCGQNRGNEQ